MITPDKLRVLAEIAQTRGAPCFVELREAADLIEKQNAADILRSMEAGE